eukprot:TRINITY_DN26387_c0_g1_i1.p1 TRINITY_DN26387_c0_g1~~TRINITY_DN26387_c0_g1_i1.p1  ORF type:complete len:250 (-),score=43.11 TRINITY_DN26387_c0_g1_i1:83-832(-)
MDLGSESDGDPEPACPPPDWVAPIVESAKKWIGMEVYPPSDDTFLLLEALAADSSKLVSLKPKLCIELGCGSGTVIAGLWDVLSGKVLSSEASSKGGSPTLIQPLLVAIDKNPHAARCTANLLRERKVPLANVIQGSFTSCLRHDSSPDIIVCNPPYVPTDDPEEMQGCGISVSWAGGLRGREIIDRLLPQVADILAPQGLFYLVTVAENEPEEVMSNARALGLKASIARQQQRGIEELFILRFEKSSD